MPRIEFDDSRGICLYPMVYLYLSGGLALINPRLLLLLPPIRYYPVVALGDLPLNGHLTPRQQTIVQLIAEDLTAKEIAERLNISTKTANFHRMQIKRRIGVRGTAGIVRYAIRLGIVEP